MSRSECKTGDDVFVIISLHQKLQLSRLGMASRWTLFNSAPHASTSSAPTSRPNSSISFRQQETSEWCWPKYSKLYRMAATAILEGLADTNG
mmetsp:Transcript_26585/g.50406  ORF Transcript_26585/g.50406 Transcript_26585/m.50406 type:complete len:92 (-) Transcript_26585:364-639(-)